MKYITKVAIPYGDKTIPKGALLTEDKDGDYCVGVGFEGVAWWTKEVIEANPFMFEAVPEPQSPRWTDEDMIEFCEHFNGNYGVDPKWVFNQFKRLRGIK